MLQKRLAHISSWKNNLLPRRNLCVFNPNKIMVDASQFEKDFGVPKGNL